MREFHSFLAPFLDDFVVFRKASVRLSETCMARLVQFDSHCQRHYPDASVLTQEMVIGWCGKRKTESNNSCNSRIYLVVRFIRFLRRRGKTEILEPVPPRTEHCTYIPHAFSMMELENFFHACDELPCSDKKADRLRKITIPVFFRLLYSSGMRPVEVRRLKLEDVDLRTGILSIQLSKGNAWHYVVLHDSMLELMKQYHLAVGKLYPVRTYFFPSAKNSFIQPEWVPRYFRLIWDKYNTSHAIAYEFRHNYAIENINSWTDEGFSFHAKLLYLSKNMGHSRLESTKYYYNLVPGFADVLKAHSDEDMTIPEVGVL